MNAVVEVHAPAAQASASAEVTPMQMLQIAVSQGADLDRLQKLMDLQERWEANQARKAFVVAMAAFKQTPPKIMKNKHVKFQTSKGLTEYDHATLDAVCGAVIANEERDGCPANELQMQRNATVSPAGNVGCSQWRQQD